MSEVTIERLQVEVGATSSTAAQSLEELRQKLTELKAACSGGAGLRSVVNSLKKINEAANGINAGNVEKLSALADALGKIQGIGKFSVSKKAADQLARLAQVSQIFKDADFSGFTKLSDALAPLASQLETIGQVAPGVSESLSDLAEQTERGATQAKKAGKSHINLFAAIAVGYKTVQRAARSIAGLIDKSNTYIENINLFNASLGKFAGKAQEYAEHVGDIMGIDPGAWMRNQGVFQTLATGFGVAADRAYIMSKNLTQLGYDLSSFFNIAVDGEGGAMQKLQAGLSGELEPLRRLGYDLSQARLKAVALSLGIDQTFNSMTQAQKAQLRYYAIMTQVTKAQGDMARTLDTPANQLRILKAQTEQAARALGNIFIPILNKILPYAIAAARAIRMIADAVAELLGFKLPEIDYSGLNTAVDATDDIDDSMSSALGSAKKMNELLADWDELNIIASESGGSGGGSGSSVNGEDWMWELPEYDFLGGLIESKVQSIMDTITPYIQWVKDNFDEISSFAIGIGTAMLGWKIGSKFATSVAGAETLLNRVFGIVGSIATAAASIVLNVVFTGKYLETGNIGWLFGSFATDTVGAILVKRMLTKTAGADLGTFWAGALFTINGGIKLVMATKDAETEGLTEQNLATAALGAAETALGVGMISKVAFGNAISTASVLTGGAMLFGTIMATFTLSNKIAEINDGKDPVVWFGAKAAEAIGYGAAGLVASKKLLHLGKDATWTLTGVAVGLTSTINLFTTLGDAMRKGWTDLTFAKALAGAIGMGVSAAMIMNGLGLASSPMAMLAVGATTLLIALGATLVVYLDAPRVDTAVDAIDWGDIEFTADEVEKKAQSYFEYDITAKIESLKLSYDPSVVTSVDNELTDLEKEIRGIQIGLDKESSYNAIKTILIGEDGAMGEGTLIGDMKTLISNNAVTVADFVKVGNVQGGASLVATMNLTSGDINRELTEAGEAWGEYFSQGFEAVASEAANNLLTYIYEITAAATRGTRQADFQLKFGKIGLQDMTAGSAKSVVQSYIGVIDELLAVYKQDEEQAFQSVKSQYNAYTAMIDNWELAHPGEAVPEEYLARQAQLEAQLNEYANDIENGKYSKAVDAWNEDILESVKKVRAELKELYGDMDYSKFNFTGEFNDPATNMFLGSKKEALFGALGKYYGGELSKASLYDYIDDYLWTFLEQNMKSEDFAPLNIAFAKGIINPRDLFDQSDIEEIIKREFTWWNKQSLQGEESPEGGLLRQFWQENFPTPNTSGATDAMNELATTVAADVNSIKTNIQSLDGTNISITGSVRFPRMSFPKLAAGGMLDVGQMFIAREAGPELVGTIGHRTAVANNNQIEGGIASGVREANSEQNSLLAESNRYLRAIASKRFTLEPSTALARTVKRSEEMRVQSEGV